MDFDILAESPKQRLKIKISRKDHSMEPFASNVLHGLSATPKTLSPKFLYDQNGSELFERICDLPEYYPTRTERSILIDHADNIVSLTEDEVALVELGSGSSTKTVLLLEAFLRAERDLHYLPIDISKSMLVKSTRALLRKYDGLRITAMASDYLTALTTIKERQHRQKLILFLGSSIGNYERRASENFLRKIRETMTDNDMLLIGMDLAKSKDILIPAYDDARGVTAAFNLNLLARINRELDGDFDLSQFHHRARFNRDESRVEMHLESLKDQEVYIGELDRSFHFSKGETIHTENSYKYPIAGIEEMAENCGLRLERSWYDDNKWFSLNLMVPK